MDGGCALSTRLFLHELFAILCFSSLHKDQERSFSFFSHGSWLFHRAFLPSGQVFWELATAKVSAKGVEDGGGPVSQGLGEQKNSFYGFLAGQISSLVQCLEMGPHCLIKVLVRLTSEEWSWFLPWLEALGWGHLDSKKEDPMQPNTGTCMAFERFDERFVRKVWAVRGAVMLSWEPQKCCSQGCSKDICGLQLERPCHKCRNAWKIYKREGKNGWNLLTPVPREAFPLNYLILLTNTDKIIFTSTFYFESWSCAWFMSWADHEEEDIQRFWKLSLYIYVAFTQLD